MNLYIDLPELSSCGIVFGDTQKQFKCDNLKLLFFYLDRIISEYGITDIYCYRPWTSTENRYFVLIQLLAEIYKISVHCKMPSDVQMKVFNTKDEFFQGQCSKKYGAKLKKLARALALRDAIENSSR